MQDVQQIFEFEALHNRCDDIAQANNVLTEAISELMLRVRAYDNIINSRWFLTRWLSQRKIVHEMKRVDNMEGIINTAQSEREERAKVQQQILDSKAKRDNAANKRLDQTEKRLVRDLKKFEKQSGGGK